MLAKVHPLDGAIITFHIQDDRGALIAGALLQATSTDVGPWQGLSDGAGNFIASLFAGRYNLDGQRDRLRHAHAAREPRSYRHHHDRPDTGGGPQAFTGPASPTG